MAVGVFPLDATQDSADVKRSVLSIEVLSKPLCLLTYIEGGFGRAIIHISKGFSV